jgi:cytidylate kinase
MVDRSEQDPGRVIITIDGPAGTGKSTVAHQLAERLGLEFLDTGAMYRAAALIAVEREIDPSDGETLANTVREANLHFDWEEDPPLVMLGDRDVSRRIRDMDVSSVVSTVAAQKALRQVLVEEQRRIADQHPRLVTEGRDQGSIVFPEAPLRFYLHANVQVRAQRRIRQLTAVGKEIDEASIISDIKARDRIDSSRADHPLIRPEGAIDIDTSNKGIDDVVTEMEKHARRELPDAGFKR